MHRQLWEVNILIVIHNYNKRANPTLVRGVHVTYTLVLPVHLAVVLSEPVQWAPISRSSWEPGS